MGGEICSKMEFNPSTIRHERVSQDHLHESQQSINHHSNNQMLQINLSTMLKTLYFYYQWLFSRFKHHLQRFLKIGMFSNVDQLVICFCLEILSSKTQAFPHNCLVRRYSVNGQFLQIFQSVQGSFPHQNIWWKPFIFSCPLK